MSEYVNVAPETLGKSLYIPEPILRLITYESTGPAGAVQLRLICDEDTAVAVSVGALGAAVSVVVEAAEEYAEQPPALQART